MVALSFLKTSISNKLDGTEDGLLFDESDRSEGEEEEEENEADWCTDIKITPEDVEELFGDSDS